MARLTPSILLSLALGAPAVFAADAANTAIDKVEPALPAVLAASKDETTTSANSSAAARPRAVSPSVAAILATQIPKFDPNAPKPKSRLDPEDLPATTDPQNPANKIIRLDPLIVRDLVHRMPNETVVLTKKGMEEMAYKRYITSEIDRALNRFTLPLFGMSSRERAVQMYREDERLRNMADLADMARIVSITDGETGTYVKKVSDQTYMRSSDFGYQGGKSPTGNR